MALDISRRLEISPSKLLLPLSYAAIFGGTITLIGTSTNLLVSALAEQAGQPPLAMFEFSVLGGVLVVVVLAYILLLGPRALPDRIEAGGLTSKYRMSAYLSEVRLDEDSRLVGSTADEAQLWCAWEPSSRSSCRRRLPWTTTSSPPAVRRWSRRSSRATAG